MLRNDIRRALSERGIKVTAAKVSQVASQLGFSGATKADYPADEAQAIMEALCGNSARPRPQSKTVDFDRVDADETAIAHRIQSGMVAGIQADIQAIRAMADQASDVVSDALVAEVTAFKPRVYAKTAQKLEALQDGGYSLSAAFADAFDVLADGVADIHLLPEAVGHAR